MKIEKIRRRAEELVAYGDEVLATERKGGFGSYVVDFEQQKRFRAAGLSFLLNIFGKSHPYFTDFEAQVDQARPTSVKAGIGILRAALDEIDSGWMRTLRGLLSSEIFSDFLDMAEHLLSEGYKDPAAVMAGSVLEEHLRHLCDGNSISTVRNKKGVAVPIKADGLNAELARASVYSKLDQKAVTSWLGVRNSAAHGIYSDYTSEQVVLMLQGIRDFILRNPA